MAINTFTRLHLNFATIVVSGSILLLGAGAAQAGFEWIPPTPQARSIPAPDAVVATPTARTPSPQELLAPLPLQRIDRANAPTPQAAVETKPTNSAIRFKKLNAPEALLPQETAVTPNHDLNLPALNTQTPTRTSVIMPDDAPDLARTQINKKGGLGINLFPKTQTSVNEVSPPSPAPIEAPQEEVVGFGTDIPLALALQQIAPQDFTFSFGANINPGSKVSWNGGKGWKDVMSDMISPLGLHASIRGKSIFINHEQGAELSHGTLQNQPVTDAPPLQLQRNTIRDPGLGT